MAKILTLLALAASASAAGHSADPSSCCTDSRGANDRTCWGLGFRGDASTDDAKKCSGTEIRRDDCDCHMVGEDKTTPEQQKGECCQNTCYSLGWRKHGDTSGSHQCPADHVARTMGDTHWEHGDDAVENTTLQKGFCCRKLCSASGLTCPVGQGLSEQGHCDGDGCKVDSCCVTNCKTFFGDSNPLTCPDGQMEKTNHNPWDSCFGSGNPDVKDCTPSDCCENKPEPGQYNCWYHSDAGDGWRSAGDTSGTKQCPAGQAARQYHDGHMMGQPSASYTEKQCKWQWSLHLTSVTVCPLLPTTNRSLTYFT